MKRLLAAYKNLPPELRMLLALLGLGSPLGAIYILKKFLFPTWPIPLVILVVAGAIAVIALAAYLIHAIFQRGAKRRRARMADQLADQSAAGPISMDVRAAIKANNEKFFNAIRDMRRNVGLDVYDLPWYVVIGDSGCGKTKLINEGGLTFSTGKPEGYQLGTLNYNWWFTEDAIFVDMAGRLCNPRDDADRREWEAFLATIGRGRRGFPINGVLVCVSADHLLQDSPEQVERDANTTLERLRDLQSRLGVTFATYLIVTKCDKILGFMQFFDRAERDITFKNQVFGWSRAGNFNELYDPERFAEDFDRLYGRLHDLRLRRLGDDADPIDLGLAYGFPEQFRPLHPALQTYVRTLFPMLKNPRAVRNLIFRGIYFTSATQEGSLILKYLTERLGADAAGQFAPLDLYPNKRPHFIKDLLFRKVFPEHGLVFRNEQQAIRNIRMAQTLKWGGAALAVLLIGTLGLSLYKFNAVIGEARDFVDQRLNPDDPAPGAEEALGLALELDKYVSKLSASKFWASLLSGFVGAGKPMKMLKAINAALSEVAVLRPTLSGEVREGLGYFPVSDFRDEQSLQLGERFTRAFREFLVWSACEEEPLPIAQIQHAGFQTLAGVVTAPESLVVRHQKGIDERATEYFAHIQALGRWSSTPAVALRGTDEAFRRTLEGALRTVTAYWRRYAQLDEEHPDDHIRRWMKIRAQCAAIDTSYDRLLKMTPPRTPPLEDADALLAQFHAEFAKIAGAVEALRKETAAPAKSLREALLEQRKQWTDYRDSLKDAARSCSYALDPSLDGKLKDWVKSVEEAAWTSLRDAGLTDQPYDDRIFERIEQHLREVPARYGHIITVTAGPAGSPGKIDVSEGAQSIARILADLETEMKAAEGKSFADVTTPEDWTRRLDGHLTAMETIPKSPERLEELDDHWRREALVRLHSALLTLARCREGRNLLTAIHDRLGESPSEWAFAQLVQGWNDSEASFFQMRIPEGAKAKAARPTEESPEPEPAPRAGRGRRSRRAQAGATPAIPAASLDQGRRIPACASPIQRFAWKRADEMAELWWLVEEFGGGVYLAGRSENPPLHEACLRRLEAAGRGYFNEYVASWARTYESSSIGGLEELNTSARNWESLGEQLDPQKGTRSDLRGRVAQELEAGLAQILAAIPFWDYYQDEQTRQWTRDVDPSDIHWARVSGWMRDALDRHWPREFRRFTETAVAPPGLYRPGAAPEPPWTVLARAFVEQWKNMAAGIAQNQPIGTRSFAVPGRLPTYSKIPWNHVSALRKQADLVDERFTGQLLNFEGTAQRLLSEALTQALVHLQSQSFLNVQSRSSWPYLPAQGPLATLPHDEFKEFVAKVRQVHKALEPLEEGLPADDPLVVRRDKFWRTCEAWDSFLGNPVTVTVSPADPTQAPFPSPRVPDTPQNYYAAVELDLGLAEKAPRFNAFRGEQEGQKITWNWSVVPRKVRVALVEGHALKDRPLKYEDYPLELGDAGPLALGAYLNQQNLKHDNAWYTRHEFDLHAWFKAKGQAALVSEGTRVGVGFRFRLEPDLPGPIPTLEPTVP